MRPTREGRTGANRTGLIFKGLGVDPDNETDEPPPPDDWASAANGGLAYIPVLPPPSLGDPTDLNLQSGTDSDGGGNRPVTDPTNANDGSLVTLAGRTSFFNGGGTKTWYLKADLGSAQQVDDIVVRGGFGNAGENDPAWEIEHSPDGTTWTTAAGSYVWNGGTNPRTATLTLTSSQTKRYWRIGQTITYSGLIYPLKVHTLQINGPQTITPTEVIWISAPMSIDDDDSTYEQVSDDSVTAAGLALWRGTLADTFLISSAETLIGFETGGAVSVAIQAGNVDDYSDAATVATLTTTASGSFTADTLTTSWTPTDAFLYWQLVIDASDAVYLYEVSLFGPTDPTGIHGDLTGLADPDQHPATAVSVADSAGWFTGTNAETALAELAAKAVGYQDHGSMGASETFDAAIGYHSGTLNANCTFTLTGAPSGTVSSLFLELIMDGTGGWLITLPASVVNKTDIESEQVTTASETTFLALLSRDGGTSWYGGWWGGPGSGGGSASSITFTPAGSISATNVQDAIEEVAAEAGGTGAGRQLIAVPVGANETGGTNLAPTANDAFWSHVNLVAPMKVRGLAFSVNTSNTGAIEWGLFDFSSNAAAATKLCGGSAAVGGTGWRVIAATSAPVDVAAGSYALIFKAPSANVPTLVYNNLGTLDGRIVRKQASYTWDDTPNLTTGWADSAGPFTIRLVGDIDGSTQFP